MIEVRWHGRGGQGAVTAATIVCRAAVEEGKHAQAFPSFGPERRGAPVVSFNRLNEKPIWIRSEIEHPDVVVVLDETLLPEATRGLKPGGTAVLNSTRSPEKIEEFSAAAKLATVDADRIALEHLGAPIVNTAMVGAFVRATELVKLESVVGVIRGIFKKTLAEKNIKAIRLAYEETRIR